MRTTVVLAACALMLGACESTPARPDAGSDSGAGAIDAGRDGGTTSRPDSGPGDPCEASNDNAASTVGCNGGLLGASAAANDFGGRCTASDADPAGSCTNANAFCYANESGDGLCLTTCTPSASTYVSTGDCPTGSRCFAFSDGALCFPDCNAGSDCTTDSCDGEGSCVEPEVTPPEDGGVGDGGVGDGGVADGGSLLPDASLPDASVPIDAGVAP